MSAAEDGGPGVAEELRRRRTALGWTLEQVAEQAQVSVGMLSLIETGKRRPSLRSWERIREALGISEPLPEEAWRQQPREISDELVATLGASLATPRFPTEVADLDVAFFDPVDTSEAREAELEGHLGRLLPGVRWDVKNQEHPTETGTDQVLLRLSAQHFRADSAQSRSESYQRGSSKEQWNPFRGAHDTARHSFPVRCV